MVENVCSCDHKWTGHSAGSTLRKRLHPLEMIGIGWSIMHGSPQRYVGQQRKVYALMLGRLDETRRREARVVANENASDPSFLLQAKRQRRWSVERRDSNWSTGYVCGSKFGCSTCIYGKCRVIESHFIGHEKTDRYVRLPRMGPIAGCRQAG